MEINSLTSGIFPVELFAQEEECQRAKLVRSRVAERTPTDFKIYEFDNGMTLICYVYYRDLSIPIDGEITWEKEGEGIRVHYEGRSLYFKQTAPYAYKVEWQQ